MRRWNGWGDEAIIYHLPVSAANYLNELVGEGLPIPDISIDRVLDSLPHSRLHDHVLINTDPELRLRHARGQSLPDWIQLRSGRIDTFPDGVAFPENEDQVIELIDYAQQAGVYLIPYGGGTSVVGHINPLPCDIPSLTIDLARLDQLIDLDKTDCLATFGSGVAGPHLEAQLNQRGYTLGHYPQSFEQSTLGGWIATRSSGQQSYYYGRIEDLFAGGRLITTTGLLDLPTFPASAAGPDLRQIILGSEGRMGIITRATVRIRPIPQSEGFYSAFFHDWDSGVAALRQIAQDRTPVSMLRLSNSLETRLTLVLSGKEKLVGRAGGAFRALGYGDERCMLIYGITGDQRLASFAHRQVKTAIRSHGGLPIGSIIGKMWKKTRFLTPYLRNTLWELGYAVDTLETALNWSQVLPAERAILSALHNGLANSGERVLAFAHLSHVYPDGASLYVTYLYRRASDPDETLERWRALKHAASLEIIAHAGTISHQHGIGVDHTGYLPAEKGKIGMRVLTDLIYSVDPGGIFNPGKLVLTGKEDASLKENT